MRFFLFPFLLILFSVSGQSNRQAEDSARIELRNKFFFEKDGKFGLKDSLEKKVTTPIFDDITFFEKNLFLVRQDLKFGLIDHNGNTIIPIQYKSIKDSQANFDKIFNVEINKFLEHQLQGFFFAYTDDDDNQYGIYTKQGKLIYPPAIHHINAAKEFKNKVYFNVIEYPEIKGFSADYEGNAIKVKQVKLVKLENNKFEYQPVNISYSNLSFVDIKNKNILFYQDNFRSGFYDVETGQKTLPKYLDYFVSNNKIYAKKEKFFNYIIDENLKETISKDSINGVFNDYYFIQDGENVRLKKNGTVSSFSYSAMGSVPYYYKYDSNYPKDEDYDQFLKQLITFFPDKNIRKFGVMDFEGKIFVKPNYENINVYPLQVFLRGSYNEDLKEYYKKNHLDYLIIAVNEEEGYKIINSIGEELVHIDSKTYNGFLSQDYYFKDSEQGITKDFFYKNFSSYQTGFFVYDISQKKIVLETDEGVFSSRKNGGFVKRSFKENPTVFTVTYYSDRLKELYEETIPIKSYDEIERNIINGKEMYSFENGKVGLIDFNGKKILAAIYDQIKIVNFHFKNYTYSGEEDLITSFIVTKNGKTGLLNDKYKQIIPAEYDEIKYLSNPYFEAYQVKKNNKFGLVSKNNVILIPVLENDEIEYIEDRKSFKVQNNERAFFRKEYNKDHIWSNFKYEKFLIKDLNVIEIK